jgi:ABC-type dipeptide/oligopeptide/nickel transport system permease subunit
LIPRKPWQIAVSRLASNRGALISFFIIVGYVFLALLPFFDFVGLKTAAMEFNDTTLASTFALPSWTHPFGTDHVGRDVFSRAIMGTQVSLFLGFASGLMLVPIAIVIGALAGYYGGWIDEISGYLMSVIVAIPGMLIILTLVQFGGRSFWMIAVAFAVTGWVGLARVVRGTFLQTREYEYVLAARALGASDFRIIFFHILPNVFHFVIINFVLNFVEVIKSEVFLAFVGLSVANVPSWGTMIDLSKQEVVAGNWQNLAAATVFMWIFLAALNVFGDGLRDALDPKLRNKV